MLHEEGIVLILDDMVYASKNKQMHNEIIEQLRMDTQSKKHVCHDAMLLEGLQFARGKQDSKEVICQVVLILVRHEVPKLEKNLVLHKVDVIDFELVIAGLAEQRLYRDMIDVFIL